MPHYGKSRPKNLPLAIISRPRMEMKITNTMGSIRALTCNPLDILSRTAQVSKIRQSLDSLYKLAINEVARDNLLAAYVSIGKVMLHPRAMKTHCSSAVASANRALKVFQHPNVRSFDEW